jgi:glycerol-3-phosphate acyltransferase PlsY
VAVAGYLLGSVPTGFLMGKARGLDLRAAGSGNIGATNALRVLGKPAGVTVLGMDVLKGAVACWGVPRLVVAWDPGWGADAERLALVAGIAAVLGHNYTCWLRFKGGKGIATSAGVLVVLMPVALLIALGIWGAVFALSRYVSLASIAAAFALPWVVWATQRSGELTVVAGALAVLAIGKHRANIRRLLRGDEHRFSRPPKNAAPTALP